MKNKKLINFDLYIKVHVELQENKICKSTLKLKRSDSVFYARSTFR